MLEQKAPSFSDLLSVPHVFGETDCWWLVREVFSRYGIGIAEYDVAREAVTKANYDLGFFSNIIKENLPDKWEPISDPETPCLITMAISLPEYHHVAVHIGYGKFIHNSSMRGKTTIERLDNPIYATRKFYRYINNSN